MLSEEKKLISVVFPIYNERENLKPLYDQTVKALSEVKINHEILFIDDGSHDGSLEAIKDLARQDPCVRFVSLSRNFGHQAALLAGLQFSHGDAVVTMDADLQHPPSLLPTMIRSWKEEGYDVVYTVKKIAQRSRWIILQARLFYWFLSKLSPLKLSFGQSDFRLLDKKIVHLINTIPEYRKFLRGLVQWVGFKQTALEYEEEKRFRGHSKYPYRSLLGFAMDGILSFSFLPLRWSFVVGLMIGFLSFLYGIYYLVLGILNISMGFNLQWPPGWATLAVAILFLTGIQLIALGILSEYVGRIYEQTKGRPAFIVKETSDL